jgi:hypothetical protein
MSKFFVKAAIIAAAAWLVLAGCENPTDGEKKGDKGGSFTLTDAETYNDKYAIVKATLADDDEDADNNRKLIGMAGESTQSPQGIKISKGTVTIPLYSLVSKTTLAPYSGNDTTTEFEVLIDDVVGVQENSLVATITFSSVTFANGQATKSVSKSTVE